MSAAGHVPAAASSGTRAAIAKLKAAAPVVLTARTHELMKTMPGPVAADFQLAMQQKRLGRGFGNPRTSSPGTLEKYAKATAYACRACADEGVTLESYADLGGRAALEAMNRLVEKRIWLESYLGTLLGSIRVVSRLLYGQTLPLLLPHISACNRAPRRRRPRRGTTEQCLAGAVAIAAVAEVCKVAGQQARSAAFLRDAALLAAAAELSGRRGEYAVSDCATAKRRTAGGKITFQFYWDRSIRKNRKTRIGVVRDPRAMALLEEIADGRKDGPLFRTQDERPTAEWAVYTSICRSTLLALGTESCPTAIRAAGTDGSGDPREMADRIGSTPAVALEYYARSLMQDGCALLDDAMDSNAGDPA